MITSGLVFKILVGLGLSLGFLYGGAYLTGAWKNYKQIKREEKVLKKGLENKEKKCSFSLTEFC